MKFLRKCMFLLLYLSTIPYIVFESIKFYNKNENISFLNWFLVGAEASWHTLEYEFYE